MIKEIFKGIVEGLLIPLLFIGALYLVFYVFEKTITDQVVSSALLFGIGLNALLMRFYFKKDKDYPARGIMIASFGWFIFLVLKFFVNK
ncbi:MAG: hypothetical protein ABF242_04170 [Flavobacteriales bacterium]